MDKNKFWLGGRLFNTASPRLGAPMQRKARPQVGRPNATQGTSAKLGAPTQRKATSRKKGVPQRTSATQRAQSDRVAAPQRNTRHVPQTQGKATSAKLGGPTHVRNANARHVRNLERPNATQGERPQDGHPNAKLIRNENVRTRGH
jgi:hypothetical protein